MYQTTIKTTASAKLPHKGAKIHFQSQLITFNARNIIKVKVMINKAANSKREGCMFIFL